MNPATAASPSTLGIAVTPDAHSAYVTNTLQATISQYDLGPRETLVPKAQPTISRRSSRRRGRVPDGTPCGTGYCHVTFATTGPNAIPLAQAYGAGMVDAAAAVR